MAKKKSFRRFARAKKAYKSARRHSKNIVGKLPIMTFGYGLVRPTIANFMLNISSRLPFGEYNDEVVLGVAGYALSKFGKGTISNIGHKMLDVEGYRMGELTQSKVMGVQGTANTQFYV